MNREDVIRMAREAGFESFDHRADDWVCFGDEIERFANLVAAEERERIKWDTIHSCHPECDKPVCVAIRKAVAAEREKVAQWMMAHGYATGHGDTIEDLLVALDIEIVDRWTRAVVNAVHGEREACAAILDTMAAKDKLSNYYVVAALAIRARGQ